MADKLSVPPHSLDAERAVLGSIFVDKEALIKISDFLASDDFYHDAHRIVYEAVMTLYDKRIPIDLVTLTNSLEDNNHLQLIGGVSYLAGLANEVPTSTHIFQYASIVKQKSVLRKLIKAGDSIKGFGYQEDTEIDKLIDNAEKALFSVSQQHINDRFVHIKDVLSKTYEKISDLHDPETKDKYRGIPTGFRDMDNILSGLQPADLVVLAARPSMGKTALALNVAQNAAKRGFSVGLISLEMSKEQLVERMFCSLMAVDSWKLRTGKLSDDDFGKIGNVMDELNKMKIYIDDSVGGSISELKAKARRLKMEQGLDVLIIDYLQLMSSSGSGSTYQQNRVQEISEISRSLKELARDLSIPIIALSQLSRAVEMRPSKIPQLSDLRESGAIEQDADVVLMMYREDYYEEDSDRPGLTDIYVRKHRNGPIGRVELSFKKEQMRFVSVERDRKEGEYTVGV
ncbi:replicative DNA helicase [Candidatus Peregrinibacteria bacterium]|jgi:replicative DNA helicase|nr:replicative DNA helicase [Candidatus Peregrinibacteria bacterium]MBT4147670.1 replicative DNA helicase [Candidatus Peregrinibacteria bacterium]MBT4366091.1 replicative DNA helicase [Candidatus Peregrinibacteria bacterium]MBT4455798.1 replicative DNA helicase [Candidatus Peregrinibacteria bacterium]